MMRMCDMHEISILDKHCLTIEETSIRFGIGVRNLREFIRDYEDELFVLHVGKKILIKQELFKKFIDEEVTRI